VRSPHRPSSLASQAAAGPRKSPSPTAGSRPTSPEPRPPGATGGSHQGKLRPEPFIYLECAANQGGISFSQNAARLTIAGEHELTVFDIVTGGTVTKMTRPARLRCTALSRAGNVVVCGGFDGRVSLFNLAAGTELCNFDTTNPVAGQDDDGGSRIVRSSDLSSDNTRLAVGSERMGKGEVMLYRVHNMHAKRFASEEKHHGGLLHRWEFPKPVWCVRFSPDGSLLAVAGYDCRLTLLNMITFEVFTCVNYTSTAGPAFIWSLAFAPDSRRLALGCWNGSAYLYEVNDVPSEGDMLNPDRPIKVMAELGRVQRSNRVYAVALDARGRHMLVGGRDKRVAMYRVEDGTGHLHLAWEHQAIDFVYTVALSTDQRFCVHGGTSKVVTVLDGFSGVQLFSVGTQGTVWSVTLLGDATHMAFAGEINKVTVTNLQTQQDVLSLPCEEVVYDVTLSANSICYTNGTWVSLYGQGGTGYGWRDPPSFKVVTGIIMSTITDEARLVGCMRLLIDSHPALVNSRHPATDASLLQMVVSRCHNTALLELMLQARCKIGMQSDAYGCTPLKQALKQGKWQALQRLLDALHQQRFTILPDSMRSVTNCFEELAEHYPREFLGYIRSLPLQAEPEILEDADNFDVMLPRMLLAGSSHRCPKGLWSAELEAFRRRAARDGRRPSLVEVESLTSGSFSVRSHDAPLLQGRTMGFNRTSSAGLQAFRVPIENFAGFRLQEKEAGGSSKSALELIVNSVSATEVRSTRAPAPVPRPRPVARAYVRALESVCAGLQRLRRAAA
jgi:WD40 repeat protein